MHFAPLRRLAGAAVVALSLVAAAPAAGGIYSYVSQADDGTMIALAPR